MVDRLRPEDDHNPGEPSQRNRDLSRYSESFTWLHLARLSRNTAPIQSDKCAMGMPLSATSAVNLSFSVEDEVFQLLTSDLRRGESVQRRI